MSRQPSSPRRDAKLAVRLMRRSDILIDRGKFSNALDICQQALEADPGSAEIYRRVGALAVLLKRPQTAVDALEIALTLDPTDSVALCNMGGALRDLGRTDEARLRLESSVRANPGHPSGWFNLGMVYADLARWSDAVLCYRRALQGAPRHAKAAAGLSASLLALGRGEEAVATARQALAWEPDFPELHISLSEALLTTGDLAGGFLEYEWRWRVPALARARRHAQTALWQGQPLAGRRLLVHGEQGFGDQLQMCRFVPLIEGATEIVLEVPANLVRLCRTLAVRQGTSLEVVASESNGLSCDFQCPIMSLPVACGVKTPSDVPSCVPYVRAAPDDVAAWRRKLQDMKGLKVGLCWSSGVRSDMISRIVQARKSIPFGLLSVIADIPGCSFVGLQTDQAHLDSQLPDTKLQVRDFADELVDFADTAALVECLDLIITVDTAVAHLAGAIGKPVWLLNRSEGDWRWSPSQDVAPWYPTLVQFRQPEPGAWADIMRSVHDMLTELASSPQKADRMA